MHPVSITTRIPSIDIYATYRCNLRCKHCFVGPRLELGTHFKLDLLRNLIKTAPSWGTNEVTFLGGEPSLYPHLVEVIGLCQDVGMKARIVTNGQKSFERFMDAFEGRELPHVCFSIDGSDRSVNDAIRGKGAFDKLIRAISIANSRGYQTSGIISISRANASDCELLLELCEQLGFEYVNVHYVTNRGYATADSVLSIEEWLALVQVITAKSQTLKLDVRVERTFVPNREFAGGCAVREQSNLMFFPDGRVYICAMFIDLPNAHSYTWTDQGLIPNHFGFSERRTCAQESPVHCPAIARVNPGLAEEAQKRGLAVRCIYDKSCLRLGQETIDTHGKHLSPRATREVCDEAPLI